MTKVSTQPLPDDALLQRYNDGSGHYTDCFMAQYPRRITLPQFVEAFYTAPLFKAERLILRFAVNRPSTDEEAANIAQGNATKFAAWDLEDRQQNQLLMCDFAAKTRSWFMIRDHGDGTQLFFGSAVVVNPKTGKLGPLIGLTTWLHVAYSRALLRGAVKRLSQGPTLTAAQ